MTMTIHALEAAHVRVGDGDLDLTSRLDQDTPSRRVVVVIVFLLPYLQKLLL